MNAVTWVSAKTKTRSKNSSSGVTDASSVPWRTAGCGTCTATLSPVRHRRVITNLEPPCPAGTLTVASRPRAVRITVSRTGRLSRVAEAICRDETTAPMVSRRRTSRLTSVVYVLPATPDRVAETSTEPEPSRMSVPATPGLTVRDLRHHGYAAATEIGRDAEPLVHHRPDRPVRTPGLHHHRALGEQLVDVGAEVAAGHDLRHHAGHLPQARVHLRLRVAAGVDALLVSTPAGRSCPR